MNPPAGRESSLWRKIFTYKFIILALLAVLLGAASILLKDRTFDPEFFRDIGISLCIAGIVGFAVDLYARQEFERIIIEHVKDACDASSLSPKLDRLHQELSGRLDSLQQMIVLASELTALGLRRIHPTRDEIDFRTFIRAAKPGTEICLLGIGMMSFTDPQMKHLLELKMLEKCTIKLLILAPASEYVRLRAEEEGRDAEEDLRLAISNADGLHRNWINYELRADLRERIELGHYDSAAHVLIVSTSHAMIVGPYLRGDRGEHLPHVELDIREGGLYAPFMRHFELLWATRTRVAPTSKAPAVPATPPTGT
ncbi:MAG: hypothetical protein ACJ8J0_22580 [Longimicrobiaceae bacterium]